MLFNSEEFLFFFLPLFLIIYFSIGGFGLLLLASTWVLFASLVFYGWEDPVRLTAIIVSSITFNYIVGSTLIARRSKLLLALGVGGNLLFLGYFKYADFLVQTFAGLTGLPIPSPHVELPIGISFYTFTQIAFLVDAYRRAATEYHPIRYGVFVTFFPHLIAGPILHHKEIMPQFDDPRAYRFQPDSFQLGLFWFAIGLFKKAVFADSISTYVNPAFDAVASGESIGFADAWIATVAYGLQLYFDFSGYSDMAIGLALMIGIQFPLNFNSPYKAQSLVDFWRRWNMTLSRFLRDYLYFPLGGNRRGVPRRYMNLLITMFLGGLWHGASWNFAVWGLIHGFGLTINHAWQTLAERSGVQLPGLIASALTLGVVLLAWVPFRADTLTHTVSMWQAMFGMKGLWGEAAVPVMPSLLGIALLSLIALFAPNSQQIIGAFAGGKPFRFLPQPGRVAWAAIMGAVFGIAVATSLSTPTTFLYFRF